MNDTISEDIPEISLEEFINKHNKLLSALGIFFAVVAFTRTADNWALNIATFASLCGLILIWYEILRKLSKKVSISLFLFRYVLILLGTGIILYWASEFRLIWDAFLWIPTAFAIFSLVFWSLLPIVRRFKFTRSLFGIDTENKKPHHKFFRKTAIAIMLILSAIYAMPISIAINTIFDAIKN